MLLDNLYFSIISFCGRRRSISAVVANTSVPRVDNADSIHVHPEDASIKADTIKTKLSAEYLENFQLPDIETEDETITIHGKDVTRQKIVTIEGVKVNKVTTKNLRKICSPLSVSGYKNKNKNEVLMLIAQQNHTVAGHGQIYGGDCEDATISDESTTRRELQCTFLLLQIMFSDNFSHRLIGLATIRKRLELNGRVSVEDKFWSHIQAAFGDDSDKNVGKMQLGH